MSLNYVKLSMSLIGVCDGKYEAEVEQFGVKCVRFSFGGGGVKTLAFLYFMTPPDVNIFGMVEW